MSYSLKREILNSLWMWFWISCSADLLRVLVCNVHVLFWIDFWWYLAMVPNWHLAASNFNVNINQLSKIIAEGTRRTMHITFNYCGCWHTRTRYLDFTVIYIVMVNASVDDRRYKFPCAQNPMNVDCRIHETSPRPRLRCWMAKYGSLWDCYHHNALGDCSKIYTSPLK